MKKIGIIGGTAWMSTVEYYAALCRMSETRGLPIPEYSIESLDLERARSYFGRSGDDASWARFDDYYRTALARLEASGAEIAFFAANTPHHRFDAIVRSAAIPVVHIVDATARTLRERNIRRVLLLGTKQTMESDALRARFSANGVEAVIPPREDCTRTIELIERLQRGTIEGADREIAGMAHGCPVALACTELPLAFPSHVADGVFEEAGTTYFNTLALHIAAIYEAAAR